MSTMTKPQATRKTMFSPDNTDKEHDCDGGPMGTDDECKNPKPCCRGCKRKREEEDEQDNRKVD